MSVAILCAIPQELALLRGELVGGSVLPTPTGDVVEGTLDGQAVVLAQAGIGKVNTAIAATLLVERFRPRVVVFTGVAGGVDPTLAVGDVIIGERTVCHDTGVIADDAFLHSQPGHIPFFNPTDRFGYEPSPELLARIRNRVRGLTLPACDVGGTRRRPRIVFGTILTGDQFVDSVEARERLRRELGGQAVEMEGAALAQTAETLGVDHLVIRALSDLAGGGSIVDFGRFLPVAADLSARVLRRLLPVL